MGYFDPFYAGNHTVLPGIGTIFTQQVGNAFTHSIEHQFKAEGAEKPVMGRVLFSVAINDDGTTVWNVKELSGPSTRHLGWKDPRPTEQDQTDYPAEVLAKMREISETYEESSATGWFFHVHDQAVEDLKILARKRDDLVRSTTLLKDLLSDPSAPETHFVSAEEAVAEKGYSRTATPEEREARRTMWRRNLARDKTRLVDHDARFGDRTLMLERIRKALRDWSGRRSNDRLPSQVVADAVAQTAQLRAA